MGSLFSGMVPGRIKKFIKRKSGIADMFFSLERLKSIAFNPQQVVDVGAYEGEWTRECLHIFPDAKYLMIEPMKQKQAKLDLVIAAAPNVRYETALLGAREGEEVSFAEVETASSVLQEFVSDHARTTRITRNLNTMLPMLGIQKVDLIKLDVQGYELEILKGFDEFLPNVEVIITEASLLDLHKGVPLVRDVMNFMFDYGFVLYDICSLSTRRPLDHALWQTDLLFVKENSIFRSDKRYSG